MQCQIISFLMLMSWAGCLYSTNLASNEKYAGEAHLGASQSLPQPSEGKTQAPVTISGQIGDVAASLAWVFPVGGTDVLIDILGEEGLSLSSGNLQRHLAQVQPGEQLHVQVDWLPQASGQLVVHVSGLFQGTIQHKVQVFRVGLPPDAPQGLGAGRQHPQGLAPGASDVIPLPAQQTISPRSSGQ